MFSISLASVLHRYQHGLVTSVDPDRVARIAVDLQRGAAGNELLVDIANKLVAGAATIIRVRHQVFFFFEVSYFIYVVSNMRAPPSFVCGRSFLKHFLGSRLPAGVGTGPKRSNRGVRQKIPVLL